MIHREPVLPPEFLYPIDEWRWVEKAFSPELIPQMESVFAISNGYLGMTGAFEEGEPARHHGVFINGFHETWPIPYAEWAYGFATTGQTIVNVPDGKIIRLYVDDEPFDLASARIIEYERALDLRAGTLDRTVIWETPAGRRLRVESRRLISFVEKHVAALQYRVTVLNQPASLVISSELVEHPPVEISGMADPRHGKRFTDPVLDRVHTDSRELRLMNGYLTRSSRMALVCGIDHRLQTECPASSTMVNDAGRSKVVFQIDATPDVPVTLTKYLTYQSSRTDKSDELVERAGRTLDRVVTQGFEPLLAKQRSYLDDFWERSDVQAGGHHPRGQQCLRWNLFQLIQAAGRADFAGIPARGLTSQTYDGHYFWDMEIYILPFLIYTCPRLARNILQFRYSILDKARERARALSQRGALFPWRTINGEEASAYYAASTAQYHINAAVAYAVVKYVEISGDEEFLFRSGAEMLVETARLWFDLGFFSPRRDGRFCIHGVTGPDEYTTVVNNNAYTNLMARANLLFAAEAVERLRTASPVHYRGLLLRTGLAPHEIDDWRRAADLMYVPFDERLGIHPQDDTFLDLEEWDTANTPAEQYPLLLHFHPLVIYRHQAIKQADVVLAMFLLGDEFSSEQKRRNFDYYDPRTTGDSSLSACIQSIMAAELGETALARRYLLQALLIDLADLSGSVRDGCHIASMAGTWMTLIYGMAGLRDRGGHLRFEPSDAVRELRFRLTVRGQRLSVDIGRETVTYGLQGNAALRFSHRDEVIELAPGQAVTRPRRGSARGMAASEAQRFGQSS